MTEQPTPPTDPLESYIRRHLFIGWGALLVFLTVGILLETFHALKTGWYLDVPNQTRRLMLTLGHAHGALLSLVNILFALTLRAQPPRDQTWLDWASPTLVGGTLLLPGGFLLGGIFVHGGDPGLAVILAPVGALLIAAGVFGAARAARGTFPH